MRGTRTGLVGGKRGALTFDGLPVVADGTARGERRAPLRFRLRPGDEVEVLIEDEQAVVQRVVARSPTPVIGELIVHGRYAHVESLSPEYKGRVSLLDAPTDGTHGDTVAVQIEDEDRRGLVGRVIEVVSTKRGAAHAAETLLLSHGVPTEWPEDVLRATERLPQQIQPARHADRVDLRELPLVTIDGETAKDFDDAVFAEKRRTGWRLVVAIADVGHYVKAGGALDLSAWDRGTSVYLADRVVPMLPEALSNYLCSLRPQEPKLALVCDMRISERGQITRHEFYEAVISSWQRLTYTRVAEYLQTGALDVQPQVRESVTQLKAVYDALRAERDERGGLDFDTHEATLELDGEGQIKAIHPVLRNDAHKLIEEAMIAANVCAARFLEKAGVKALYRIHDAPEGDKAEQVRQAFAFAGVRLGRGQLTPKGLFAALAQLGERPDRWIFEMLILRSMTQARYSPDNVGHFGLALPRYMHFTSPIRRYADLVVHRAIKAVLNGKHPGTSDDWLVATGEQTSMTERRADEVAWGVEGWLKCEHAARRIGEEFDGVVMGVTEFGLFVELSGYYVQGLVHISELGADYFQYQPQSLALVGERSGRRFTLGDQLRVQLVEAVPSQGRLELLLVKRAGNNAGKGGKGGKESKGKRRRR